MRAGAVIPCVILTRVYVEKSLWLVCGILVLHLAKGFLFYNRKRIHEANGYLTPEEYYRQRQTDLKAA